MKIALLGDIALYGKFSTNNKEIFNYLSSVKEILSECDYVVGNLETPFAEIGAKHYGYKSAYIKAYPENIKILKYLGVNAVCLANNHTFDYGKISFELTKKILKDNNIEYFGIAEKKDVVKQVGNSKIVLCGFCCYSTNPQGCGNNGINEYDYTTVVNDLKEKNDNGYNVIMSVHAGQEHVNYPNPDHIKIARSLARESSFVYYGHHPHVLQGFEEYNNSLLYYSLGNFCFDDVYTNKSKEPLIKMSENNKSSMIVILEYNDNKLISHKEIPIYDAQLIEEKCIVISKQISLYCDKLSKIDEEYQIMRNTILNEYISSRKSMRDMQWYLKRINYSSIRQIINAKANYKLYSKCIKKYCNE